MTSELYPLRFTPILKEKIWGGEKLGNILGKSTNGMDQVGESWEISAVESDPSIVSEGYLKGRDLSGLLIEFKERLVGKRVYKKYGNWFPLLFKYIDANDDLSIQVHPQEGLENSKTEMWYIMESDPGASLYSGFVKQETPESFKKEFLLGNILKILNRDQVNKYDAFFLPSGRVHSIGKGMLLAEIQQNSDTTYRLYDFDRLDNQGNSRELHIDQGSDALDFSQIGSNKKTIIPHVGCQELINSKYFNSRLWQLDAGHSANMVNSNDSFLVYMVLGGNGYLEWNEKRFALNIGDSILVPAEIQNFRMIATSNWEFLEVWVP